MATSYLYVIETNGESGVVEFCEQLYNNNLGQAIKQFKVYNSWGHLLIPGFGPSPRLQWILIMAVVTEGGGMKKADYQPI